MTLADLASNLKRLDSLNPNNPKLYCVFDIDLVAVGDTDRINDKDWEFAWFCNSDPTLYEHTTDMFNALEQVSEGDDELNINGEEYEKLKMLRVKKLVSVFFTYQAAQRFIDGGRHEFREPYVEAIPLDRRNVEMRNVLSLIANTF